MPKIQVEIDDTLDERVETAKEELRDEYINKLADTANLGESNLFDCLEDKISDTRHEITDSNTPIYYTEIDGLYYLYGDELEESYKNAGIGSGGEKNHKQVTIYYYISQELYTYEQTIKEIIKQIQEDCNDDTFYVSAGKWKKADNKARIEVLKSYFN